MRKLFGIFLLALVIGFLIFTYSENKKKISSTNDNSLDNETSTFSLLKNPSPTPFLFNDLTIPFLRSKNYDSSLGEMKKEGDNASYESFVTSYNSDGFKINGFLTRPKGTAPDGGWPAIVFLHGYIPPKNYRTEVNYASYVDYFAKQGFVVFKIDLRGHDESEGDASGGYYSGDYVVDTLSAVEALKKSGFVNRLKIGLWGHSMSGNITFRSFVASGKIPALVIWAGAGYTYTDLQEYTIDDNSYRPPAPESEAAKKRQKLRETYGSFEKDHWFWKQVPATNYLESTKGAIQLNHAVDDNVVSIDYSRNLVRVLEGTNVKHELKEYKTGGHNLTGPTFTEAMQNSIEFFRKYL